MDKQVRSGHDLPASRSSATGSASAHLPVGEPRHLIYLGGDAGGGYGEYRIIPTDNRKRDANAEFDITYMGNSVGRWEGDTLVIDSISFIDTTWLGHGGFFHSDQMHVVEKFTRRGDTLLYDVTVDDPEVLVEPWVLPTRVIRTNPNGDDG